MFKEGDDCIVSTRRGSVRSVRSVVGRGGGGGIGVAQDAGR